MLLLRSFDISEKETARERTHIVHYGPHLCSGRRFHLHNQSALYPSTIA